MKKYLSIQLLVSALLVMLTIAPAFGAGKKKKEPPTPPPVPTIASVTATSVTVNEEKATKTFTITQFTEINVNGKRATAAELQPGMTVNVTMGTDKAVAARISATGSGTPAKPDHGHDKKKK